MGSLRSPIAVTDSDAVFSNCKLYRYVLYRIWDKSKPNILFIGLNPSTADATKNDPTIRRCIGFASRWGFGSLSVANLFAYRTSKPSELRSFPNPIGPDNDKWLRKLSSEAHFILACWGNQGCLANRDQEILSWIRDLSCLGITQKGQPVHPLYIPYGVKPIPMPKIS